MKLISSHTSNEMTRKVKNNRATNAFLSLIFYQNILGYRDKVCGNLIEITTDGFYKKCLGNPCIKTQSA